VTNSSKIAGLPSDLFAEGNERMARKTEAVWAWPRAKTDLRFTGRIGLRSKVPFVCKNAISYLATLVSFAQDMFPGVSTEDIGVWLADDGELVVSVRGGGALAAN
jgi:hypothetical protein